MSTVKVAYIGHKSVKADNVAGTGMFWEGHGSVRDVPEAAAKKLLAFPGVWALLDVTDTEPKTEQPDTDDKAALLAVAHGLGIKIDGRSSAAKIAAAIQAAQKG